MPGGLSLLPALHCRGILHHRLAHALVLWAGSKAAWGTAASVAGRELCLTLPFIFPMTVLFRAVYWRAHRND